MNANAPHRNTDAIDVSIDRALSTLRDAQPRSGLEGRILFSLEHRATLGGLPFHEVKGWGIVCGSKREGSRRIAHLALWAATSAALIVLTSLTILHYRDVPTQLARSSQSISTQPKIPVILSQAPGAPPSASEGRQAGVAMSVSPVALSSRPDFSSRHPERSASARSRRTPVFVDAQTPHNDGVTTPDDGAAVGMGKVTTTPDDAQALADLHAPSHPAPPLPLTQQEKLFLRGLRYGNLTQLAELNPVVRAQQDADETAAFKTFFPDPPPLKQPLGDTE